MAKRRVLLVDDDVAILLTMKTVLEVHGFAVETAASAREARMKIKHGEYQMVMTDMRMESDAAGREVIEAARVATYHPAVALLTAYPEDDWSEMGADQMLVKPMQTAKLLEQIEHLLASHAAKLARLAEAAAAPTKKPAPEPAKRPAAKRFASKTLPVAKKAATKKAVAKTPVAKKASSLTKAGRKKVSTKKRKRQ